MEFEEHLTLSRSEVAGRLHDLADQIAEGKLAIGKVETDVAERVEYEVDFEVDHHKRELKIELEWR
ncbi:MAG TPA: amphi-Trp domain-containing protein [Chloroflexota bacterium]